MISVEHMTRTGSKEGSPTPESGQGPGSALAEVLHRGPVRPPGQAGPQRPRTTGE